MKAKWMTSVMALALAGGTFAQTAGLPQVGQTTQVSAQPAGQNSAATTRPGASVNSYSSGSGYGGGGVGRSSSSTFANRLNTIVARAGSSSPTMGSVITFEPMTSKAIEEIQEDLKVFGLILYRGLERAMGDRSTEYKLGVPMLLQGDHRVVQANYLDGFGVIVKVTVPFPVAASENEVKVKRDAAAPTTEWEKARRALLGVEGDSDLDPAGSPALVYDDKLIATLKKQMFEALKNGLNLRHVKADDWISIVIVGVASNSGDPGARMNGSILGMRVKKSALDGSVEQIEQAAQSNAYLDVFDVPPAMTRYPTPGR